MRGGENDKEEEKHTDFSNVKRRVECVTFNTGRTRGERKKEREELFPTIFFLLPNRNFIQNVLT